ncbi:MAG: GWxTD domain-containing protein [Bacteroidia bacterium]
MKRMLFLFIPAMLLFNTMNGNVLSALLTWCAFTTPDHKPYVETYISILGNSAVYAKNSNGKMQASIEIGMLFTKAGKIEAARKFVLHSPERKDSLIPPSFIDQQRFNLPAGDYELELTMLDKNSPSSKSFLKKETIHIPFQKEELRISDIEFIESYTPSAQPGPLTKNGYDLVPYIASLYPKNMNKLAFYAEVYEAPKVIKAGEKFVLRFYVEQVDDSVRMSECGGFVKCAPLPVNIILTELNIDKLPSGRYNLVIELYASDNRILSVQKRFFQRLNPVKSELIALEKLGDDQLKQSFAGRFHNLDTLSDLLLSLRPVSNEVEMGVIENEIKGKEIKILQKRLLAYWLGQNPKDPETAFDRYSEQVVAVQKSYGTRLRRGYETDRGRVYLKYGEPSTRQITDKEPSSYPYEIWTYYRLSDGQTNRKFVFYNRDLVTNDYRLIHSDAIGEIYDSNWSMKLHARSNPTNDMDQTVAPDHFGGNSSEDYDHPK